MFLLARVASALQDRDCFFNRADATLQETSQPLCVFNRYLDMPIARVGRDTDKE
jgi:hypothetical protein